jgi:excisionase family DNA binding protein
MIAVQATIDINAQPAFYSVDDIQRLLGIGRNTAYKLVGKKGFPTVHIGNRIIVPADLFNEWITKQVAGKNGGGINGKRSQGQG